MKKVSLKEKKEKAAIAKIKKIAGSIKWGKGITSEYVDRVLQEYKGTI